MKKISLLKKISLSVVALIAALAVSAPAHADPTPGWYVGLGGILNDTNQANAKYGPPGNNTINYDLGWGGEGNVGYSFKSGFRLEGETAYIHSGVKSFSNGGTGGSGSLADTDLTANAYYDFKTGTMFTPYIGGGAGLAVSTANSMGTLGNGKTMNDTQELFVYQAIAGVSAQLTPHWALTADYRYIATTDPRFATSGGGNATIDNASHNIVVSVRYSLFPPPPPVMPQQAVAPTVPVVAPAKPNVAEVPESYMVFFDFDKSVLTPEAERILASAAEEFKKGGYIKIVVTGHTDTSGPNAYNQKLSERRAASVKAELEKLGVPDNTIVAEGVGKNGLLVPTADQVREAQNRRAEIVFTKE